MPKCSLCSRLADPRHGLMTVEGHYYALCDGCAPFDGDGSDDAVNVANKCRASGVEPVDPLSRFGHNEAGA